MTNKLYVGLFAAILTMSGCHEETVDGNAIKSGAKYSIYIHGSGNTFYTDDVNFLSESVDFDNKENGKRVVVYGRFTVEEL